MFPVILLSNQVCPLAPCSCSLDARKNHILLFLTTYLVSVVCYAFGHHPLQLLDGPPGPTPPMLQAAQDVVVLLEGTYSSLSHDFVALCAHLLLLCPLSKETDSRSTNSNTTTTASTHLLPLSLCPALPPYAQIKSSIPHDKHTHNALPCCPSSTARPRQRFPLPQCPLCSRPHLPQRWLKCEDRRAT